MYGQYQDLECCMCPYILNPNLQELKNLSQIR